jgi:hypothetical protein
MFYLAILFIEGVLFMYRFAIIFLYEAADEDGDTVII